MQSKLIYAIKRKKLDKLVKLNNYLAYAIHEKYELEAEIKSCEKKIKKLRKSILKTYR